MQILIQIKAVLIGLFLLFFVLMPAHLIAAPFKLRTRLKITGPAWQLFGFMVMRYAVHAKVKIREDHRAPEFKGRPCTGLYVANHQSFLDIPLLLSCFQAPTIMKKEIMNYPIFGWMAWVSGAIPVSRESIASRRKVFDRARKRILVEKTGLQVYPEGTRSKETVPREFKQIKKTLLVWAFNEKIPVIPTTMYGTRGILSSKGKIQTGKDIGIIIGSAIYPSDYPDANTFAEAAWGTVVKNYYQMKDQLTAQNEN